MNWEKALISPSASLADAMESISASALQTAIVTAPDKTLLGTLTDGDIRRAILNGADLQESVINYMCPDPHIVSKSTSDEEAYALMKTHSIHFLPIVDSKSKVIGVKSYDFTFIASQSYDNVVVIMAGGKGTRLGSLTKNTPKPMLKINNKPILEILLERFISQGFNNFVFAVNYLSEQITEYFQDGSRYGISISYLQEKVRSGTAGALSLLPTTELPIIVSNADLLTKFHFGHLLEYHVASNSSITIASRQEAYTIPFGVIESENGRVIAIKEKPSYTFIVNAGIYVISPSLLPLVPSNSFYDMTDLIDAAIDKQYSINTLNVDDYWIDIGRPPQLDQALKDFNYHFHV